MHELKGIGTSPNRSVTVRRLTAARLRKIPVGASPLCGILLRHIFLRPKKCSAFSLIGRKKTSVTAGTLGEIIFQT